MRLAALSFCVIIYLYRTQKAFKMRTEIAMITEIHEINRKIAELKPAFEAYIKNQDYPLDERWSAFCQANNAMKNYGHYYYEFKSLNEGALMDEGWLLHVERREVVDTERIVEAAECYNDDMEGHGEDRLIDVDALKEEILSHNLGSYEYDW